MAVRLSACLALALCASPLLAQDVLAEAERFEAENMEGEVVHAGDDHAAHPEGLPVEPRADLALWSGIVFLLFVGVLSAMAWKPAAAGLDRREERIRNDLAAAEKHRVESERLMSQHSAEMAKAQDQVKEILAEARRDAEVAKANILAEAQAAARTERERALHDIEQAKDQALAELFAGFNDQLAAATEQVLGRDNLTDETQKRLIDQSIAGFRGSRA
ncbi:ATP synthase F0 subunit B [Alienimonas californiensis]|uniref:ATP synthase subunit b n=1 Tax=Alienimonas californiensis TaxID=2527989 RepID=A0A517PBI6_9PLAN|nr:ATP synthase F0 subunit B [Alienimonas californiensis]QDT16721.1 ATP synthase subunit b [Alienimonas californiensis]